LKTHTSLSLWGGNEFSTDRKGKGVQGRRKYSDFGVSVTSHRLGEFQPIAGNEPCGKIAVEVQKKEKAVRDAGGPNDRLGEYKRKRPGKVHRA